MSRIKRNILLTITGLVLSGVLIGFYLYNKEGPDIKNANSIKVTAPYLYDLFLNDSIAAKNLYLDKVLEVSGVVSAVSKNQQQQAIVLLKTNSNEASVNCTLEVPAINITQGDKVFIKGICNGLGQGDTALGIAPDVYLSRCYSVP